jgi:hypothetical protein
MSKELIPGDLQNIDAMLDLTQELAELPSEEIRTPLSYFDLADILIRNIEYIEAEQADKKLT